MIKENSGNMEVNISHDLSRKMSITRYDRFSNFGNDLYMASKIEMRQGQVKEVQ
ncbi:MAG: hypothetical protein GY754_15115 [bacterium]|nr:hypothetical protein [bacterium]